jgi:hypothetical protein
VPLEGYGGEKMTIAEFFRTYYHVFDSYESIRRYGRRRGCRIVNDSAKSFIDAFDRT